MSYRSIQQIWELIPPAYRFLNIKQKALGIVKIWELNHMYSFRNNILKYPLTCVLLCLKSSNLIGSLIVSYLNNRVFLSRNYWLIVAPRKFDVLTTNMLVLRTSNFQEPTIRSIVPRHKHSIVFIVHH